MRKMWVEQRFILIIKGNGVSKKKKKKSFITSQSCNENAALQFENFHWWSTTYVGFL